MILIQASRNAMVHDLVVWTVADLAAVPPQTGSARRENNLVLGLSAGGPRCGTDVPVEFKRITEKAALSLDAARTAAIMLGRCSSSGKTVGGRPGPSADQDLTDQRVRLMSSGNSRD